MLERGAEDGRAFAHGGQVVGVLEEPKLRGE
jgi:hypothetical protein